MATVSCDNCGKSYAVKDEYAGRKVTCKQCGNSMRVPGEKVTVATAAPVAAPGPKAVATTPRPVRKSAPPPPPPPAPDMPFESEGDDGADFDTLASLESTGEVDNSIPVMESAATTPRASKSFVAKPKLPNVRMPSIAMPRIGFRLNRLVLGLIIGGIVLGVFGGQQWLLASKASDVAQEITCEQLGENGPGNNVHVHVTKFLPMPNYIYQYRQGNNGDWQTAWYPIISPEAIKKARTGGFFGTVDKSRILNGDEIHVIIKTTQAKGQNDMESVMKRDSVEGMVINSVEHMNEKERDLLQQSYPGISLGHCFIVEDGRQPQGGLGMLMLGGGALLVLAGLFAMFKPA